MRRLRLPSSVACLLLTVTCLTASLTSTQFAGFASAHGDAELNTWISRVNAAGGTFAGDSKTIAKNFLHQLRTKTYNKKIVYLLPLLGSNLAAARVPLRDSLHVGIAGNTNFVDADFSQSTGLQGNGSTKRLDSHVWAGAVGAGSNGGLGFWETNFTGSGNNEPIAGNHGSPDIRCSITLGPSSKTFVWGGISAAAYATVSNSDTNGDYYGQRTSSSARELWRNGTQIATGSTTSTAMPDGTETIDIMSASYTGSHFPYPGRCAVAYMTDGTLTGGEIADLHTLLQDYILTPTGR